MARFIFCKPFSQFGGLEVAQLFTSGRNSNPLSIYLDWSSASIDHTVRNGTQTLTLRGAWEVYEHWLNDPRIEFYPEPKKIDDAFRETTKPFLKHSASKAVGDCYLLAYATESYATLVTFDKALKALAHKSGYPAVVPG